MSYGSFRRIKLKITQKLDTWAAIDSGVSVTRWLDKKQVGVTTLTEDEPMLRRLINFCHEIKKTHDNCKSILSCSENMSRSVWTALL